MNKVKILSRDDCNYCNDAKGFLAGMEVEYTEVHQSEGRVPQIYIGDYHIGGYEDLIKFSMTPEWDTYF